MNTKKSEKLSFLMLFNIVYILLLGYIASIYRESFFTFSLGYAALGVINIVTGIAIIKKGYFKFNIAYAFMALIAVFSIISTVFAYRKDVALFGFVDRYEGLISILYYITVMFLASFINKMYKKKIIIFILIFGLIQTCCAILQVLNIPIVHLVYNPYNETELWATGFLINPNFFGTCTLLCLSISLGCFINENKSKKLLIYGAFVSIFMFGLLISNTTSCAVGLFVVLGVLFVYSILNKKIKNFLFIFIILTVITVIAVIAHKTTLLNDIIQTGSEAAQITKGNVEGSFGTKRMFIWTETLKAAPKYLVHGVGIDNFAYAFDGQMLSYRSHGIIYHYDKAHNEYLQILITEGVLCLITYIVMYVYIVVKGLKKCFTTKNIFLVLPIIGYLIQAVFNISMIIVAPLFFIILGLCLEEIKN